MDSLAFGNQSPMISLLGGSVKQSRIPSERDRNRSAVGQLSGERVRRDIHTQNRHLDFSYRHTEMVAVTCPASNPGVLFSPDNLQICYGSFSRTVKTTSPEPTLPAASWTRMTKT